MTLVDQSPVTNSKYPKHSMTLVDQSPVTDSKFQLSITLVDQSHL